MNSRQILIASAMASAVAVCAPAQAVTSFTGQGSSTIVNGSGAFYDTLIPKGDFTDTIDFNVPTDGSADVGVLYFKVKDGLSNLQASFNGAAINLVNVGGNLFSGGVTRSVLKGTQTITLTGRSAGNGAYSGNVTFSSAVPELATWLMMIAGIGFTGLAMRRRKTAYSVNYAF
ncbi:FxDxF family PEP-CTERM protein [uncultured Novosphingobium sp.]|uniref:FxDxF family PEP-CTERM protein n=1 Tax=uncultured Novosphingobium sp. TaxID=292277 RepID=UPI0025883E84|nr:FxDxF family PEP-CTERM protein [uncultured Novosphingobium sp.]